MSTLKLALGLCRTKPPHELLAEEGGFVQCSRLLNYICRDSKITKIPGTEHYNPIALDGGNGTPWVHRSYHKRADGSWRVVVFCFHNGAIYYGDDVAQTLTEAQAGFTNTAIPQQETMQVSGNSILYFFSGEDEVYKYDGNGGFQWEKTTIGADLGRTIIGGTVHLDRMWYISKNSSTIAYSTTLLPEDFSTDAADIVVGQETDSVARAIVVGADETLYIFKNNSIWRLTGRTPASFIFTKITDKYGLANKRAIKAVGSGFVFLDELTKELYFFGGSEASIYPLTERDIRLRDILDIVQIDKACMTVHDGLFRFSFKHKDDNEFQDRELIYAITELDQSKLPKWSMSKGAKIHSYSVWDQQGDDQELVTGRVDVGKIMYHNRNNNWDDSTPIETIVRTAEVVAEEGKVVRFDGFFVKSASLSRTTKVKFKYFLDGRDSQEGSEDQIMKGETRTLGELELSQQIYCNTRIIPLVAKSRGTSISFQIEDNNLNTFMEFYNISFTAKERYIRRTQLDHVAP